MLASTMYEMEGRIDAAPDGNIPAPATPKNGMKHFDI